MTIHSHRRWGIFARQSLWDIKLWVFVLLVQQLWHIVFFIIVAPDIETFPNASEAVLLLLNAFLFDSRTSGSFVLFSWLLISLPATLLAKERATASLRSSWLVIIWVATCIANLGHIGYYYEYHTTFDFNFFALFYDDFDAIAATVYHEYNLLLYLLIFIAISVIGSVLLVGFFRKQFLAINYQALKLPKNLYFYHLCGGAMVLLCLLLLLLSIRASLGVFPLNYENIEVTRDTISNRAALNPFNALIESYKQHRKIIGGKGINAFTNVAIEDVLSRLFPGQSGATLDDFPVKQVAGVNQKPRHVFLLMLESYSSWPLLEKYSDLHLLPGMQQLAADPKGRLFLHFLPSSTGTMTSFASMITGMQDVSVYTNYQQQSLSPYATSLPAQFKNMGYRTRFFYGGSENWHDVGSFLTNQGVDEIHTRANIAPVNSAFVWGLPDGQLFDYVLDTVDDSVPSLNIIMTVSFHPPYNLDMQQLGIDTSQLEKTIASKYPNSVDANTLGHWKYADREMYRFIRTMESTLDNSLFVATGDHYANNKHVLNNPPLYEKTSVPLLLYGHALQDTTIDLGQPGTHLDIAPTILELTMPAQSNYYSLGNDLLTGTRDFAVSSQAVISRDFIAPISTLSSARSLPENQPITLDTQLSKDISEHNNLINAYSWWRIMKGRDIP